MRKSKGLSWQMIALLVLGLAVALILFVLAGTSLTTSKSIDDFLYQVWNMFRPTPPPADGGPPQGSAALPKDRDSWTEYNFYAEQLWSSQDAKGSMLSDDYKAGMYSFYIPETFANVVRFNFLVANDNKYLYIDQWEYLHFWFKSSVTGNLEVYFNDVNLRSKFSCPVGIYQPPNVWKEYMIDLQDKCISLVASEDTKLAGIVISIAASGGKKIYIDNLFICRGYPCYQTLPDCPYNCQDSISCDYPVHGRPIDTQCLGKYNCPTGQCCCGNKIWCDEKSSQCPWYCSGCANCPVTIGGICEDVGTYDTQKCISCGWPCSDACVETQCYPHERCT